ncbi:MAG: DUF5131 family protein [Anaerolineae bacterium]
MDGLHLESGGRLPDGSDAVCYAETIAQRLAQNAYPHGFEHHYWRPDLLEQPLKVKTPSRIFLDSMSDLMGHWVPDEQIEQVLDSCRRAHWHSFQLLTKNAPRLLDFDFPPNVWVGGSVPPSQMFGRALSPHQQSRLLARMLDVLEQIEVPVCWMSLMPTTRASSSKATSTGRLGERRCPTPTLSPLPDNLSQLASTASRAATAALTG